MSNEATLRLPPHNLEAEQSLLGALLIDPQAIDRISQLSEAHLYRASHRVLFSGISALMAAGKGCDPVTLAAHLDQRGELAGIEGGRPYIDALSLSVPSARHIERYAELIREKAQRRAVIAAGEDLVAAAFGSANIAEAVDTAQAKLSGIATSGSAKVPRRISEIAIERTRHYEDLEAGRVIAGWPCGIQKLDSMLGGGFRPGGLYILAARPSVGKSSLALWIAHKLAGRGHPSLVLSQEMPEAEVADRAVALAGRVDYGSIVTGRMDSDGWQGAVDAMESLATLPLWIDDEPALTLAGLRAKARFVPGLRVLVLDYLQLCAGSREGENRNAEIEAITRGLKALAKSGGLAIIALSQLNRDVEKRTVKRPMLADLRDSGAIEQDADAVLMLWTHYENEGDPNKVIGCGVEKNRQGRKGVLGLHFEGNFQRWGESAVDVTAPVQKQHGGTKL